MSNVNTSSHGLSQNVTIRQGRVTVKDKTAEVGAVVQINARQHATAFESAKGNGADDIWFRTDAGDVYVASGVGFEKLGLRQGNAVQINGVKGRITSVENESNTTRERIVSGVLRSAGMGGALGAMGALVGLMGTGSFLGIGIIGGIGVVAGIGMGIASVFGTPNLDLLKLYGKEVQ